MGGSVTVTAISGGVDSWSVIHTATKREIVVIIDSGQLRLQPKHHTSLDQFTVKKNSDI